MKNCKIPDWMDDNAVIIGFVLGFVSMGLLCL